MGKVVELKEEDIIKAYNDGDTSNKNLLKNMVPHLFGNITERIKTFEDICIISSENIADYQMPANATKRQIKKVALSRIELAAEVIHDGKDIDWKDMNKPKYEPVFFNKGIGLSGFGFSPAFYGSANTSASLGSRFATRELAEFIAKLMVTEYYQAITGLLA